MIALVFLAMMNWEMLLNSTRFEATTTSKKIKNPTRSEFEKDYDRIIFSAPFRNLQDKTQVFPLPEDDFVHTRLTHSLEVSSVGRSLGKACGEYLIQSYPDLDKMGINAADIGAIVAAAALSHDIGNPPFGHAGEEAISDFFKHHDYGKIWQPYVKPAEWIDLCNFEGNAQGFRMLLSNVHGLKLSYATLAAFTKYPRQADISEIDKSRRSQKKYGFFSNQSTEFTHLAETLGVNALNSKSWLRHPLAFLVEAADDICYSIIDLEDGCTLGLVSFEEVVYLLAEILGKQFKPEKLEKYKTNSQKLGILRAMTINKLVEECVAVFKRKEKAMLDGKFDEALTDCIPSCEALKKIALLSVAKIYRSRPVLEKEAAGYQVLEGLLEVFSKALNHKFYQTEYYSGRDKSILRLLPEDFPMDGRDAEVDTYPMLRRLVDFVSGMTDKYAISLYKKVKGISIHTI